MEQIGQNRGSLNSKVLAEKVTALEHGDVVEFLAGEFPHELIFVPKPPKKPKTSIEKSKETERKRSASPIRSSPKTKKMKNESSGSDFFLDDEEIVVKKIEANEDGFEWEKVNDGEAYIMTGNGCEAEEKVSGSNYEPRPLSHFEFFKFLRSRHSTWIPRSSPQ